MNIIKYKLLKDGLSGLEILEKPNKQERYIISCESDWIIRQGARVLAKSRDIPKKNRFYFSKKTPSGRKGFGKELPEQKNNDEPLKKLSKHSRLDIVGHGAPQNFQCMSASTLAQDLKNAGLKEVGILKLQSCFVGQEKFLDQLKDELQKLAIKVGYLCGPTGIAVDPRFYAKICGVEFIFRALPMKLVSHEIPSLGNVIFKPEKFGLKVVQGDELNVAYRKTRYMPRR